MGTAWQPRNDSNGQFGYEGQWDRVCQCGHTLGVHTAAAPHECMNGDRGLIPDGATGEQCDCRKFRPAKPKKS